MDLNARVQKMSKLKIFKGIVNDGVEDPNTQAISWEPGDGLRYNLIFNILPSPINYLIGNSKKHILVSYHDGTKIRSASLLDGATHMLGYISIVFGMDAEDPRIFYLTALLNMTIGNFDLGYSQFKEQRK